MEVIATWIERCISCLKSVCLAMCMCRAGCRNQMIGSIYIECTYDMNVFVILVYASIFLACMKKNKQTTNKQNSLSFSFSLLLLFLLCCTSLVFSSLAFFSPLTKISSLRILQFNYAAGFCTRSREQDMYIHILERRVDGPLVL